MWFHRKKAQLLSDAGDGTAAACEACRRRWHLRTFGASHGCIFGAGDTAEARGSGRAVPRADLKYI